MGLISDFMSDGFEEFSDLFGESQPFTIEGYPRTYLGDLDEFGVESQSLARQGGGLVGAYTGCILAAASQFASIANAERVLEGKRLTAKGRTFRIASATLDDAFLTIRLENWSK